MYPVGGMESLENMAVVNGKQIQSHMILACKETNLISIKQFKVRQLTLYNSVTYIEYIRIYHCT